MANSGYVVLTYKFRKIDKRWTAYCEELGTATFGRSLPEAEKRLKEAVLLHLDTLEDVREHERFFRENNIHVHEVKPEKDITVCIPLTQEVFVSPQILQIPSLSITCKHT